MLAQTRDRNRERERERDRDRLRFDGRTHSSASTPALANQLNAMALAPSASSSTQVLARSTPPGDPRFSTRIEDYELGSIIGRGGFAIVHQAVSKHPASYGHEVAIKIIDKAIMNQSNLSERVATELQIHSTLSHPSILHLYTHFQSHSHVYLVTELCTNGELYRYIQRRQNGPYLSEAEARGVMEEIVKGVLYLHSNGIIHRDLKLANVLITRDYHVKIADFGLAVKLNNPEGEQKTMCGTPNYISPEIVSRQPYGLSSDLWSLGCMLVTILTGKPPFDSQAVKSTLDKVSRVEYYLPDSISNEARDLIGRLLMKVW
ncbi:Serine/threonine-protein kinase plk4 [Rhizoclosmatium sp. JEL0117]|nr:Serine/threonine-protein kinase plk4 [Rhizoclosmatium sp. JEL0117]